MNFVRRQTFVINYRIQWNGTRMQYVRDFVDVPKKLLSATEKTCIYKINGDFTLPQVIIMISVFAYSSISTGHYNEIGME